MSQSHSVTGTPSSGCLAPSRVVLVGLSGSGKSALARRLGPRLGWDWADTDEWVVARTGRTIAEIFEQDGEPAFRQLEHDALRALSARPRLVLATGGGIITLADNWPLLRSHAVVVWLRATPAEIVARLQRQQHRSPTTVRPLLAGDPLARLKALSDARDHLYAQADISVLTDGRPLRQVAEDVLAHLRDVGVTPGAAASPSSGP